jgi:hypothetical protein
VIRGMGIQTPDDTTCDRSSHSQLLSRIHLFLIDEVSRSCDIRPCHELRMQVHILNESRGSTLEVVVCRMKARGSAVRFVAVSATVPNIDDVAHWIASRYSNGAAATFQVSCRSHCPRTCIDCSTVWGSIPALPTLTFRIRLSKVQKSKRLFVFAIPELSTVPTSSATLCQQTDIGLRFNSEG